MEIGELQVRIGSSAAGARDWSWLQRSRSPIGNVERLRGQLGELLFGVPLSPEQMLSYRMKLAEVLDLLQHFEQPFAPLPAELIVPREKRIYPVGAIAWRPAAVQQGEPYAATPVQVFQKRKILEFWSSVEREAEICTHMVQIKLAQGLELSSGGADTVLLTPAGLNQLQNPVDPPVTVLRLPPRVFKQVDLLKVARGA